MFVFVSGFLFQTTALKGGAGIFFAKVGNVNFGVECGTVDSAVAWLWHLTRYSIQRLGV